MNREFIVKMIKAKKLELEAIQELLPDKLKAAMDEMGDIVKEFTKECIMELYFSGKTEHQNAGDENGENESAKRNSSKEQKPVKKITIE